MVVIKNLTEVVLVIFFLALIMERLVAPNFNIFGTRYVDLKWIIKSIIDASIPGILFFISGNYLLLHAWLNAWAEMLRFADRLFYEASLTHMVARLSFNGNVLRAKISINSQQRPILGNFSKLLEKLYTRL